MERCQTDRFSLLLHLSFEPTTFGHNFAGICHSVYPLHVRIQVSKIQGISLCFLARTLPLSECLTSSILESKFPGSIRQKNPFTNGI